MTIQTQTLSDSHRGIWVFAEQRDGIFKNVDFELLSKGRELADTLKTELSAVCLGHNVSELDRLLTAARIKSI